MIILSCGHEVDSFDESHQVVVKSTDRENEKALAFMSVCQSCKNRYQREGELFETNEQGYQWLGEKEW